MAHRLSRNVVISPKMKKTLRTLRYSHMFKLWFQRIYLGITTAGGSSNSSSNSSSSRRQQQGAASKQQASRKQAESKQKAATSVCPVERIMKYNISFINQRNTKIELFLGTRPQNNEIVQLLKVVVMPNLNFFQAHGLPIQLLRADTT